MLHIIIIYTIFILTCQRIYIINQETTISYRKLETITKINLQYSPDYKHL